MAKSLVQHHTANFKASEFHDTYRENVECLIEEKKRGKKVTVIKQPRNVPVIDLMEALKKSLQSTSRPATAGEPTWARKASARKRRAA